MNRGTNEAIPDTVEAWIDPASTAVIVWDMQEGIAPRAFNCAEAIIGTQRLLEAAYEHSVLVIWSKHYTPPLALTSVAGMRRLMERQRVSDPCDVEPRMQKDTPETGFVAGLVPGPFDVLIEKTTPSIFIGTPLDTWLHAAGIRTLIIGGVATELGIHFTTRHAMALGYYVVVVEDASGSFTEAGHQMGLTLLRDLTPVLPVAEIAAAWASHHGLPPK